MIYMVMKEGHALDSPAFPSLYHREKNNVKWVYFCFVTVSSI